MEISSYVVDFRGEGFSQELLSVLGENRKIGKEIDDFVWESFLIDLNHRLYSKTSLEGELFLIREDNRKWLVYVSREDKKNFFEFVNKVTTKEESLCSYKGIVRRFSSRWCAYFDDSFQLTQSVLVEIVANTYLAERGRLTLMVTQYFTDRGFSASWGRCQGCSERQ